MGLLSPPGKGGQGRSHHVQILSQGQGSLSTPSMMASWETQVSAGGDVETSEPSHIPGGKANSSAAMRNGLEVLKELNVELPCDPAIWLLGVHPKE